MYQKLFRSQILIFSEPNEFIVSHHAFWPFRLFYYFSDNRIGYTLRTRIQWLELLKNIGFREFGYSVFRAGHYDFGSLFWAIK